MPAPPSDPSLLWKNPGEVTGSPDIRGLPHCAATCPHMCASVCLYVSAATFYHMLILKTHILMFYTCRFPSDVIEHLKPNLQADPLLSRTLVACLDFPNVMFVLQSVEIPLDVIAATLIHHINHERYIFKPEKEVCFMTTHSKINKAVSFNPK